MAGMRVKIPTTFSDRAAPRTNIDPIFPARGALILMDATHPADPWPQGVPNDGSLLPNLVPKDVLPPALRNTDVRLPFTRGPYSPTKGFIERSARGGLHSAPSRTIDGVSDSFAYASFPDTVRQFLVANPSHSYYFSTWTNITRAAFDQSGVPIRWSTLEVVGFNPNPGSNYLVYLANSGNVPAGSFGYDMGRSQDKLGTGPALHNTVATAWSNPVPTDPYAQVMLLGTVGSYNYLAEQRKATPARIAYRSYVEDLTVSGRSYIEVDAIDSRLFAQHIYTPGGRYHDDAVTNPASIA